MRVDILTKFDWSIRRIAFYQTSNVRIKASHTLGHVFVLFFFHAKEPEVQEDQVETCLRSERHTATSTYVPLWLCDTMFPNDLITKIHINEADIHSLCVVRGERGFLYNHVIYLIRYQALFCFTHKHLFCFHNKPKMWVLHITFLHFY